MTESAIVFACGGESLIGIVHEPAGAAKHPGVLIVVGGPQYRVGSHRQFVLIARRLAESGYAVFRFDYRGMGDSGGQPRTFELVDEDIRSAIDVFVQHLPELRHVVILGLCDAASAAMMYACNDERVSGLILLNPWARTEYVHAEATLRYHYGRRLLRWAFWKKAIGGNVRWRQSFAEVGAALRRTLAARRGSQSAPRHFVDRMLGGLSSFRGPTLLLLSEHDLTAREFESLCSRSTEWRNAVAKPSVVVRQVPSTDHTFSSYEALKLAVKYMVDWLAQGQTFDCEGSHSIERNSG
jgi:exosortase A-associated hydrolase 1